MASNSKTYSRRLKIYIDGQEVEASVGLINKQLRKLKGEMKNLTIGTEEYEKKAAEIRQLNGILDEHRKHLKGVGEEAQKTEGVFGNMLKSITSKFTGVGENWLSQFDGVLGGMKGSWMKFAAWLGAAVVALKGAIDAGRWFYNYSEEIEEAQRLTHEFLGLAGKDLTHVQSQLSALAKSMGKDYKEVLSTVDAMMQHFGISADEAIAAIEDGIQAGADLNGTLLQQLNQFGPAAKDAGNSIQDLVAMITQTRSGIFNEGGMALIQTAENRIRTMTTATAKSLDAIGVSSKQLEDDLVSGQITMFQAVQKVSNAIMDLPQNSSAAGQAMKDVFGKTASNEGMAMIAAIADMTTNMDDLKAVTGEYGELQREQIEAEAELTEKFENFFHIGEVGFQELTGKAKLYITQALISAIDNTRKLVNWFIDFYNKSVVVRLSIQGIALGFKNIWTMARTAINLIIDQFKQLGRMLKGVATTFKGIFTFDFDLAGQGLEQIFNIGPYLKEMKDDIVDGFKDMGKNAVNAWNNTVDGKWHYVDTSGHSSDAEQSGVTVYGHRPGASGSAGADNNKGMGGKRNTKPTKDTSKDDARAAAKEEAERRKAVQKALADIDLEYQRKAAAKREAFLKGEIHSKEALEQELLHLERESLEKKLEVANIEPSERQKIVDKIISMQLQLRDQVTATLESIHQSELSQYEIQREELTDEVEKQRQILLQGYEQKLIDKATFDSSIETLEKSHRDKLQQIQDEEDEEEREKRSMSARAMFEQMGERYAIAYDMTMDFANQLGVALGKALQGEKKAWHDFLKSIIIMALDAVEKMVPIWIAHSTGKNTLAFGPAIAPMKVAIEVAAIQAAIQVAKGVVSSFSGGGYTGKGKKKEVAGLVHKGEYVIPQEGLANPAVKPVVSKIEEARAKGTLNQLTEADMAEAVSDDEQKEPLPKMSTKSVSETSETTNTTSVSSTAPDIQKVEKTAKTVKFAPTMSLISVDTMRKQVGSVANLSQTSIDNVYGSTHYTPSPGMPDMSILKEVAGAVRELKTRLDAPITAQTYTVGRGGIEEAQERVAKMRKNASRKII